MPELELLHREVDKRGKKVVDIQGKIEQERLRALGMSK